MEFRISPEKVPVAIDVSASQTPVNNNLQALTSFKDSQQSIYNTVPSPYSPPLQKNQTQKLSELQVIEEERQSPLDEKLKS